MVTELISDQQSSVKQSAQQDSDVGAPVDLQGTSLTKEQKESPSIVEENVFAKGDKDLGYSSETQHEIKLTDTKLVKQRCR